MDKKRRRTPARVVEDAFQRVYDRSGARGLVVVGMSLISGTILVITFIVALSFAGYARVPVRDLLPYSFLAVGLTSVGLLIGIVASLSHLRGVFAWSPDNDDPEAALRAWRTALATPRVIAFRSAVAAFPLLLLDLVIVYQGLDLDWRVYPVNALGTALTAVSAAVASFLFQELMFRPLVTDIARHLPEDFEPDPPRLALHTKAILPIPGMVVYTSLLIAGWVDTNASFARQLTLGILLSLAVSVAGVGLYYLLAHAFLDPVDQLTDATRRVHAGDIDFRVPLTSGDEFGVLAVSFNQMLDGLQEREQLRSHNAELSGRLEDSLEEVRASRARIVAAADEERRRMERDLHDGAQQRLVMISLKLGMAARLVADNPAAAELHAELEKDAARALEELRDLAHGIYPPLLESDGLASALEDVAEQSPYPIALDADGTGRYPAPVEAAVYFCCLEALQNAAKYAGQGSRATIRLRQDDDTLLFTVSDDGGGFDPTSANGSVGLQNMTDRIGALGGTVRVTSAPGAGTTIEGCVPVGAS